MQDRTGLIAWLPLIAMGLVVLGTGLRVASAFTGGLALLYAAIGCSTVAALLLLVAVLAGKRR